MDVGEKKAFPRDAKHMAAPMARNIALGPQCETGVRTASQRTNIGTVVAAGIKPGTVRRRLSISGFTAEEAVLTPILKNQYSVGCPAKRVRVVKRKYP